ncbi:NYN domain-containing protein [Paenibacillus oralis]|uniref:NYN domain-containing protein n=1 Tax=Paenibacillus oralis TaxID=2490856 RepID=A0A3P3TEL8_9BACL|nr:NYN domain-containing protein [Paenibacillus oralis]RRJ54873.1 NYN domain-containing protein [Paenibacillus oralis]
MRPIGKRLKSAILIDESNAIHQLHDMGITGIRSWKKFYQVVEDYLKANYGDKMLTDYNFYGTLPPKQLDETKYNNRYKFLEALKHDGINVYRGECYFQDNRYVEKGIDLLIGLDLVEFAFYKYEYVVVFSGDADFVPAVERAKKNGTLVLALLGREKAAFHLRNIVDVVIDLEMIIDQLEPDTLIRKS